MVPEPERDRASDLIRRASELNDLADYAEAAETSARAIELDPDDALAHTVRAWALENLGGQHVDEARSVYETAIALDATAPWPRTALADLLHRTGSRDEARSLYRDVAADPVESLADRPRRLEFRGWSLYRLGRLDEAIQTFHASMAGARTDLRAVRPRPFPARDGRPDEASQAYGTAVEAVRAADAAPPTRAAHVAIEDLEEAIEAHPDIAALPSTPAIRDLLRRELRALGPPSSPPSGRTRTGHLT